MAAASRREAQRAAAAIALRHASATGPAYAEPACQRSRADTAGQRRRGERRRVGERRGLRRLADRQAVDHVRGKADVLVGPLLLLLERIDIRVDVLLRELILRAAGTRQLRHVARAKLRA